jgi:hypothetical protein
MSEQADNPPQYHSQNIIVPPNQPQLPHWFIRHTKAIIALTTLFVCLPLWLCYFLFWISIPSSQSIEQALRYGPGHGGPGVGDDGNTYEITAITLPSVTAVGSPKMTIWITVRDATGKQIDAGMLGIALVGSQPILGDVTPLALWSCDEITEKGLADFGFLARRRIQQLMEQYCNPRATNP